MNGLQSTELRRWVVYELLHSDSTKVYSTTGPYSFFISECLFWDLCKRWGNLGSVFKMLNVSKLCLRYFSSSHSMRNKHLAQMHSYTIIQTCTKYARQIYTLYCNAVNCGPLLFRALFYYFSPCSVTVNMNLSGPVIKGSKTSNLMCVWDTVSV